MLSSYFQQFAFIDFLVIGLNLGLLIFAYPILRIFKAENASPEKFKLRVQIFRALNIFIILSYGYSQFYLDSNSSSIGIKLVSIGVIIYASFLSKQLMAYWIRQHYGKKREVEGKQQSLETYTSRLLSLLTGVVIFVIALLAIVNVLEFNSLLQAGGVIGIIGVFLALTQNAWAPDIISGLIFLHNRIIEEGDVIEFNDGDCILGVVYKTKIFHTEILNLVNNHRIMVKNARLREFTIHNLSKFASAKGLREKLSFKIGYDVEPNQVKAMFLEAEELVNKEMGNGDEERISFEVLVLDTGDHAIEWGVFYFTKDVRNLVKTRNMIRELILKSSLDKNIGLSTPMTHQLIQ